MNRVIKIRAWHKKTKDWPVAGWKRDSQGIWPNIDVGHWLANPDCECEQWTGLLDSTGREIYDGDVIEFKAGYFDGPRETVRGRVQWGSFDADEYAQGVECWIVSGPGLNNLPLSTIVTCGVQYSRGTETDGELPTVVGNIHENQDLLK